MTASAGRVLLKCVGAKISRFSKLRALGVPAGKIYDFSRGVDRRITASKSRRGCSRTSVYAPPPDGGLFLALHPNESVSRRTLFRRRNNENPERDVLRHDVISFGVEPLTKRSQGVALLSAKGSRFSFGRQKKQKRQGAVFRTGSPPKKVSVGYLRPLQPENSSYPPQM